MCRYRRRRRSCIRRQGYDLWQINSVVIDNLVLNKWVWKGRWNPST